MSYSLQDAREEFHAYTQINDLNLARLKQRSTELIDNIKRENIFSGEDEDLLIWLRHAETQFLITLMKIRYRNKRFS